MSEHTPLVSFVVLNWNGLEDTKASIKSIKEIDYPKVELIVVDNGSNDGSKQYLKSLKGITFIDLPTNTGFTGGHIEGRNAAQGDYIAIVNNDLVLDKMWLKACLRTFERHDDAAVVGGKAFKWNGDNPVHSLDNEFYSFQEVDPETGYTRTLLTGEEECSVDSISGAALLIKQSSLEKTGYLDGDFFAYYEETDLIARLARVGLKAYFSPKAYTWHKVAASTGEDSSFYLYMMHRNRYFFASKNLDQTHLKRFQKNYRREVMVARYRQIRNRTDADAKARTKAYGWIKKNKSMINTKRLEVQSLGGSYTDSLKVAEHNDVTIVIPSYNYGEYVAEAIDSALTQTIAPTKIIVIDDGSKDNTKAVLDGFKHNPLIEITYKANSGAIDTKNLGIKLSKTYWTVFLDADDKLSKNFLERTLKTSKKGLYDIVYTDMRLFGAIDDTFKARPFSVHTLLKSNYINNSALIKTSLLKQVGGYKKEMDHGLEDWELYITLVEAGAKPKYLPLPLVRYRQHEGSLSRNAAGYHKEDELIRQIKALHLGFYRKHGYYRSIALRAFVMLGYVLRYPGLVIVLVRSIPHAIKEALSYVYRQGLAYISNKTGKEF